MVVPERGYQRWDGDRTKAEAAMPVLIGKGVSVALAGLFRRKFFAVLLTFSAYGVFLFGLGVLYAHFFLITNEDPTFVQAAHELEENGMLALVTPSPETAWTYLFRFQKSIALIICVIVGAGLISEDRRNNALELYLSRPLAVRDYVLGKLAVVAFFVAMVTVVPAMILILVKMTLSGYDVSLLPEQVDLAWRTLAAGSVMVLVMSLLVLAASSLAKRARNAAILFFGGLVLLEGVVRGMVMDLFRGNADKFVSLDHNVGQVMAQLLGDVSHIDPETPFLRAALILAVWSAVLLGIVLRRVRPVEVVA